MTILDAVRELARIGHMTDPKAIVKIEDSNLGVGLSKLYYQMSKQSMSGWLMLKVLPISFHEGLWKKMLFEMDSPNSEKLAGIIEGITSDFVTKKKWIITHTSSSSLEDMSKLLDAIGKGDRVATAAIWYPLLSLWGRNCGVDDTRIEKELQAILRYAVSNMVAGPALNKKLTDAGLVLKRL
jgi:hypothetical protein